MPSFLQRLRLVLMLTIMSAVVVFGMHAGATRSSVGMPTAGIDANHSHDDGWDKSHRAGHAPGHNSVDHSHDLVASTVPAGTVMALETAGWQPAGANRFASRDWQPPDRPPRPVASA